MRTTLWIPGWLAAAALCGCAGESNLPNATGDATFRAINVIATSPAFTFLIEERALGSVDYRSGSGNSVFDDLEYTFNFDVLLAGDAARTRVASEFVDTVKDQLYTFVISGAVDAPTITTWVTDRRVWSGTENLFVAQMAHTAESLGDLDVYFAAPGTAPAAGQAVATLSFLDVSPAIEYPAGDYVVIYTTAGNPADVVFTSSTLTPDVANGFIVSLYDGDANTTEAVAARILNDNGGISTLLSETATATIRFFHASAALETSDVYIDEDVTDQILANHAYRDVTGDIAIAPGQTPITYTAAGNVGSLLYETTAQTFLDTHTQFYVVGTAGALVTLQFVPNRRSVETLVRFTFLHTAHNHPIVDVYVVPSGEGIADVPPRIFSVRPGTSPITTALPSGDFDLYMTVATEKTVIVGPVAFSAAYGDVLEYIAYDNVDPATADLVAIPLP